MGCDYYKEENYAYYAKCQQDMERILRSRKPISSKQYISPCGNMFTFSAKFTPPKKKKRRK